MAYFLLRMGEGSKYIEEARKDGYIAIGWNDVPNLKEAYSLDKIKKALEKSSYDYTPAQIPIRAGQVYRFGHVMKKGDIVLSPYKSGEYLVGEVGEYYFEDNPQDGCPYKHRRKIKWNDNTILKDNMSTNLSYCLGAIMTVFSIDKYNKELKALIEGKTYTKSEKPQKVREVVLSDLKKLNGKEFEHFIGHLLEVIGFTAEVTQYVGDKGIDVNGLLNAEGLADIILRVQAKRVSGVIGNKEVMALRGALSQGEHGCLLTLSGFSQQAVEESQAPGKIPIKLISGNDLAEIILKHFDEISDEYKQLFGINRKKDFNIEEQFEIRKF